MAPDRQQFPLTLRYTTTPPDFTGIRTVRTSTMAILRAFSGLAGTPAGQSTRLSGARVMPYARSPSLCTSASVRRFSALFGEPTDRAEPDTLGSTIVSDLGTALDGDGFVVTSELTPPKGTSLDLLVERARMLDRHVDAFNITDSHAARMAMAPMAVSHILIDHGVEPIMQITSRDRNRIAIQADLLGAWALGVRNIAFMGGDPPKNGDHPDAKGVFDVVSASIIRAAAGMNGGADMAGNALDGSPDFCIGAVVNPGAKDLDREIERMVEKREAGATFFQTQAVYDARAFERFVNKVESLDVRLLAGIIPVKSPKMAAYMNDHVPGIEVPDALIRKLADSSDRAATSSEMAAAVISEIRPMCRGVHVMAIGWEDKVPGILEAAGVR